MISTIVNHHPFNIIADMDFDFVTYLSWDLICELKFISSNVVNICFNYVDFKFQFKEFVLVLMMV